MYSARNSKVMIFTDYTRNQNARNELLRGNPRWISYQKAAIFALLLSIIGIVSGFIAYSGIPVSNLNTETATACFIEGTIFLVVAFLIRKGSFYLPVIKPSHAQLCQHIKKNYLNVPIYDLALLNEEDLTPEMIDKYFAKNSDQNLLECGIKGTAFNILMLHKKPSLLLAIKLFEKINEKNIQLREIDLAQGTALNYYEFQNNEILEICQYLHPSSSDIFRSMFIRGKINALLPNPKKPEAIQIYENCKQHERFSMKDFVKDLGICERSVPIQVIKDYLTCQCLYCQRCPQKAI